MQARGCRSNTWGGEGRGGEEVLAAWISGTLRWGGEQWMFRTHQGVSRGQDEQTREEAPRTGEGLLHPDSPASMGMGYILAELIRR